MEAEGRRYRTLQINVGGTIFHTTEHTLAKADDNSLLYGLIDTLTTPEDDEAEKKTTTIFFDRDPSLFEALLYVLRTGQRPAAPPSPSSSSTTHHQTLTPWFRCLQTEASFYGATKALKSAFSPSEFNGMDLTCQHLPLFEGEKSVTTAISAVADGDFAVSLGNRLSWYDWTLNKIRTVVTPLEHGIDVLAHVNNSVVVAARSKWRNIYEEEQWEKLNFPREWNTSNLSPPRSGSPICVFDANHKFQRGCISYKEHGCESVVCGDGGRIILALMQNDTEDRNKKAVLEVDAETLQVSRVVAEHEGNDLQINHYGRLQWIEGHRLLLATYAADGPSGSQEDSIIRLFDIRAPEAEIFSQIEHFRQDGVVWSEGHGKIFKINCISYDDDNNAMYAGDLRNGFVTWERCRTREATSTMAAGHFNREIIAHGKQVFGSNGKSLVVWDEVDESGLSFRQSRFHWGDTDIAGMAFGGEKLYVVRHGANFIEVLKSAHQDLI